MGRGRCQRAMGLNRLVGGQAERVPGPTNSCRGRQGLDGVGASGHGIRHLARVLVRSRAYGCVRVRTGACGCVWVRLRTRRSVRTGFDHPGPGCCGWPCRPQPAIAQSRCHRRSKAAVHHRARPRGYAGLGRSSVRQPTRRALAREPAQHLLNTCTTPRATCPPCSGGASVLATPTAALLNAPGTPPCGARLHGDQASWWSARS
jgi:hypothetical protein